MARPTILGLVVLALVVLTAPAANAHSPRATFVVGRHFVPARPFHVHPRPFLVVSPFGAYVLPYPIYVNPPVVYSAPTYYSNSVYTSGRAYTVQTIAPEPMPTVVQYPHGRYELRGDGVTVPYHWVWIPNPPPPPPNPAASSVP